MRQLVIEIVEKSVARCDRKDRFEQERLLIDGRRQERHAEADIEHARGVLRPLHIARHPEQILRSPAQHR